MKCVDSSQNLPPRCPSSEILEDCTEIDWYVRGQKTVFEICDSKTNLVFNSHNYTTLHVDQYFVN